MGKVGEKITSLHGYGEAGGLVRATISGLGKLEKLELDEKLSGKSLETIEDLVITACNQAKDDLEKKTAQEMMNLRSDPELLNIFSQMFNNNRPSGN